jgi:hypothetical protein
MRRLLRILVVLVFAGVAVMLVFYLKVAGER